jgi:hypothetical protein
MGLTAVPATKLNDCECGARRVGFRVLIPRLAPESEDSFLRNPFQPAQGAPASAASHEQEVPKVTFSRMVTTSRRVEGVIN